MNNTFLSLNSSSREYNMVLILRSIRIGLNLSCEQVSKRIYYAQTTISFYEIGRIKADRKFIMRYANFMAEYFEFEQKFFNKTLEKAASCYHNDGNLSMLNIVSKLIHDNMIHSNQLQYDYIMTSKNESISVERKISFILGCIRRILNISLKDVSKIVSNANQRELGTINTTQKYAIKYAKYISEQLLLPYNNFEGFYDILKKEATIMSESKDDMAKNGMIALANVICLLNLYTFDK
ncbi:MAG: helix-turn-helix transcriptional regulator [Clostridia bacterium]|nr:helix-turn-helix transcriptional regulator [Clostridia bacterium]